MTNPPILKMPRSHPDSELERQETNVPERTERVQSSSRTKPITTRHFNTASTAKQTSELSSRRPRKAPLPYAEERLKEEPGTEAHSDGSDGHGQRPVTAAEWNSVYQRHAQSQTPFSDSTMDMIHAMPRLLRELENMKAAADALDGGVLPDAVHDAVLDILHVGELLCEHMQGEWTAGR